MLRIRLGLVLLVGLLPITNVQAQVPEILSTQPARHASGVDGSAAVVIEFSTNMAPATVNDSTLRVYGTLSGLHAGTMSWAMQQTELTFVPDDPFELGEVVTVILTNGVESVGSVPLDDSYTWSFSITSGSVSEAFGVASKFPITDWPNQVITGDYDRDGDLDVAVAHGAGGDVTLYLNDGTATFVPGDTYSLPRSPSFLTQADLDADYDLEIVSYSLSRPYVSVLWNGGNTFTGDTLHSAVYSAGDSRNMGFADVNGDGLLDILVGKGSLTGGCAGQNFLLNGGDSTFSPTNLGFCNLGGVMADVGADLDGDGDMDVATANWRPLDSPGCVLILLNDGTGGMTLDSSYEIDVDPSFMVGADFDADGDWDLATVNMNRQTATVLLNTGSAQFTVDSTFATAAPSAQVFACDMDTDGDVDLLMEIAGSTGGVMLYVNDGSGRFSHDPDFQIGPYTRITLGDFDGDNDLDMAGLYSPADELHILLYQVRPQVASHEPATQALAAALDSPVRITFDRGMDGTSLTATTLRVYARCSGPHQGSSTYDSPTRTLQFDPAVDFRAGEVVTAILDRSFRSATGADLGQPYQWQFTSATALSTGVFTLDHSFEAGAGGTDLCVADLDGDGDLDVCTADRNDHTFSVFTNDGSGYLNLDSAFAVASEPHSICAADFDRDGDMDVATANRTQNRVQVWRNDGSGIFSGDTLYVMALEPTSLAPADYDGDGYIDLAVAHAGGNNIGILFNAGDGTFGTRDGGYGVGNPSIVTSADVDNDGDIDIAAASWDGRFMAVLRNDGDGTFAPAVPYFIGLGGSGASAGDLNGDGYADLMCVDHYDSTISVLMNSGDGTFEDRFTLKIGLGPYRVEPADLDGDGDLDLAALNFYNDNVSVFFNDGMAGFTFESNYTVAAGPMSMFVADLNGDGAVDVATSCYTSGMLSVLLNELMTCPVTVPGDQDGTGVVTAADIVYLINYILKAGPDPMPCAAVSDMNCSGESTLADVIYIVNYVFKGGPAPCDICTLIPGTWSCP